MAAMIETPVVCIDVQRAGPATGVPTKTEQGDLWQMLGAGQGDYPRVIVAPTRYWRLLQDHPRDVQPRRPFQCPGIVLCRSAAFGGQAQRRSGGSGLRRADRPRRADHHSNGHASGADGNGGYKRYKITESGISPRAVPGVPGYIHTAATDEHDEDGVLISDEFTNPTSAGP